jgi:hypothetical protein
MSKSKAIKNALVEILSNCELNGEPAFTDVKGHPRGEFDGYPSVRVLPGDQSNRKASQGQNDRTPAYVVRTHVPIQDDGSEIDYIYDLTDLILDTLDTADFENQLNELDPTIGTFILTADRGDWLPVETPTGVVQACDINVEVSYSKDN